MINVNLDNSITEVIQGQLYDLYMRSVEEGKRDAGMMEFMTKQSVLDVLDISNNTLMDNYVSKGLPTYKIGNRIYLKRSEINEFIESHRI